MRGQMRNLVVALACIMFPMLLAAENRVNPFVYSYTMEEMYSMATLFKRMAQGENLEEPKHYMAAAAFRGYVASALDNSQSKHNDISACVRRMRVNKIAFRTATIMTTNELDRSNLPPIAVHSGIIFACDEKWWDSDK